MIKRSQTYIQVQLSPVLNLEPHLKVKYMRSSNYSKALTGHYDEQYPQDTIGPIDTKRWRELANDWWKHKLRGNVELKAVADEDG